MPFNEQGYLAANPDVAKAIASGEFQSGYDHWLKHGKAEGRWIEPGENEFLSLPVRASAIMVARDPKLACAAVDSLLLQQAAMMDVHVIKQCKEPLELPEDPRITVHLGYVGMSRWEAFHQVVPKVLEEHVLVQLEQYTSSPIRANHTVNMLKTKRAEFYLANCTVLSGEVVPSREPDGTFRRFGDISTFGFLKSAYVDTGGFGLWDTEGEEEVEYVCRLGAEKRRFVASQIAVANQTAHGVVDHVPPDVRAAKAFEEYKYAQTPFKSLRAVGRDYPSTRARADVILPFRDGFQMVEMAILSILNQEGADIVLHLIDDASRDEEEALDFVAYWGKRPGVLTYRNSENLGQFMSVNNVVPYLRTDHLVIQDGDDISDPKRVQFAIHDMKLVNADLYGSHYHAFGDRKATWVNHFKRDSVLGEQGPVVELAFCAADAGHGYYMDHPTLVIKREAFIELKGYRDFGDLAQNKASVDADLLVRAHAAGHRIHVSRYPGIAKRFHAASCTQNAECGWGTDARRKAEEEWHMSMKKLREGANPRVGSLGSTAHLIEPLNQFRVPPRSLS